jgi:hypothetical protein
LTCEDIPLEWKELSGDSGICHLTFNFGHTQVFAWYHDKETGQSLFVTQEEFYRCQDNVRRQFAGKFLIFFPLFLFTFLFSYLPGFSVG